MLNHYYLSLLKSAAVTERLDQELQHFRFTAFLHLLFMVTSVFLSRFQTSSYQKLTLIVFFFIIFDTADDDPHTFNPVNLNRIAPGNIGSIADYINPFAFNFSCTGRAQ